MRAWITSRTRRVLAAAVAVVVLAAGAAVAATPLLLPRLGGEVLTLLVMGSDTGLERGGTPLSARADALHLVVVAPNRRHATILNIPRDSYLPVAGQGTTKVNACLLNGPDNCVRTFESLWGIDIDNYLLTSFDGWKDGVGRLGGVRMNVDRPLSHGGPDITSTGRQRLTGGQALTYARDRKHRPGGDFDRTQAQAELLMALHAQLTDGAPSLHDASRILGIIRSHLVTDMSPGAMLRHGLAAGRLPPRNVTARNLPGSIGSAGAASIVRLNRGAADALVSDAVADGRLGNRG